MVVRVWRQARENAAAAKDRLSGDKDVVAALQIEDFQGPAWEEFAEALVAYAHQVVLFWITSGQIVQRCREKRIWLPSNFMAPMGIGDAKELTADIVSEALVHFREILRRGEWCPDRGASLKAYFCGQCIVRFPNLYRAWLHNRSLTPLPERDEDAARVACVQPQPDPENAVIVKDHLLRIMRTLDQRTSLVLWLRYKGYKVAEIAELLNVSAKTVEGVLSRHYRRMRAEQGGQA